MKNSKNNQNLDLMTPFTTLNMKSTCLAVAMLGLTTLSCSDNKKESDTVMAENEVTENVSESSGVNNEVISNYMQVKNALVDTDQSAASEAGLKLKNSLENFAYDSYTNEDQSDLRTMITSAIKHTEEIANGDIEGQRAAFELLSEDVLKIVDITGTETTLYKQYCPMYGEDGGVWLSAEENIKNPYFGSKMMTCGEVQKEIN